MDRILTTTFCILFQVRKVLVIKFVRYSHQIFYFLLFLLAFTSANIIFHKFLELHSTLSEKKIFVLNFPFLTDSLKPPPPTQLPPPPLNSQNRLSVAKAFCQCSLTYHGFPRLLCYDDARKNQTAKQQSILQSNFNPRIVVFTHAKSCLSHWIQVSQKRLFMVGKLYRGHSIQYRHLQMARISFAVIGKILYQTKAYQDF